MSQQNTKKIALVTGGGSGIGRSICLRLAKRDIHIMVVDLNLDAANLVKDEILRDSESRCVRRRCCKPSTSSRVI